MKKTIITLGLSSITLIFGQTTQASTSAAQQTIYYTFQRQNLKTQGGDLTMKVGDKGPSKTIHLSTIPAPQNIIEFVDTIKSGGAAFAPGVSNTEPIVFTVTLDKNQPLTTAYLSASNPGSGRGFAMIKLTAPANSYIYSGAITPDQIPQTQAQVGQ